MRFSLEVLRARKGDCLMLHYGTKAAPRLMLIDGGPSGVYRPYLRPRLERLRQARGLDDAAPLPIDVVMVSHLDDDHIQGILDLTSELRDQRVNREPLLVRVQSLWHNTFDDLLDTTPDELTQAAGFGAAALSGSIDLGDGELMDAARVLASIPQGRRLRDDAALLAQGTRTWTINDRFDGELILARGRAKPVSIARGVAVIVIGPMHAELAALQRAHDKWLREQQARRRRDAQAALAAFLDSSIPNLSSLVMVVAAGRRRILLTGDARGDKILAGLEAAQLLKPGTGTVHVDVMKVPHHGSANNVDTSFFARVTADHYVFSGNGEHGNPERQALEMLLDARGTAPFVVHFTYPIDEIDEARKADWTTGRAKEKTRGRKLRPPWSAARHGLRALLSQRPLATGQKIVEMSGDVPHLIDLLDPVPV